MLGLIAALAGIGLLFWLQNDLYRKYWNRGLSVEISFSSDHASEEDRLYLYEEVKNEKMLPLPVLKAKFTTAKELLFEETEEGSVTDRYYRNDILSVMMYQRVKRKLPFVCSHRGFYTIEEIDIVGSDLFLSESFVFHLKHNKTLMVYPKHLSMQHLQLPYENIMGMAATQQRLYQDPFTFAGIREYQSYDSMKMINWNATAKTGKFQVNVPDYTANRSVRIILNLKSRFAYREKEMEEICIRIAATLAEKLLAEGVLVELESNGYLANGKENARVSQGSGVNHSRKIDETLALLCTEKEPDSIVDLIGKKQQNQTAVSVLISREYREEVQTAFLQKMQRGESCYWILPRYEEEEILIKKEIMPYFSTYDEKR